MDNTCTDNTPADNAVQPVPSSPATLPAVTLFNLEQFEWRVHTEETEQACRQLVFLLGELDRAYGQWSDHVRAYAPGQRPDTLNRHLCTRIAGAVTTLFSRPGFSISDTGYVRLMALGHPATTWSAHIDAVLVEEDYLGDPACFSERVCALPKDALPYIPPAGTTRVLPARPPFRERRKAARPRGLPVRIAVCASIMKINPGFLTALAEVQARCRVPVQFCFYMGFAQGLTLDYLREEIHDVLPEAEVNAHMEVGAYQQALNSCELFANPFPYGNMNGVVDVVRQGLPGVCMSGPEVHTHIDEGLFRRLGLPEELIAGDRETYIRAVVRLAEDDAWRESLQAQLQENDPEQVLFTGHPEKFAAAVQALWEASVSGREERAS